jgi:zinc/manganese transport system substrate-binding protein
LLFSLALSRSNLRACPLAWRAALPAQDGRAAVLLVLLALLATLAGCRQAPQAATTPVVDGPRVIAGDGVLCDLSQRLAPSQVQVDCLLGPGDDPHHFRLTPSQSQAVAQSSLLLVNGGGLTPALERLPNRVAIVDRLPGPGDLDRQDPHLWHDPAQAALMVREVAAQLAVLAPQSRGEIEARSAALQSLLADLDRWNRRQLATIPLGVDGQRPPVAMAHRALSSYSGAYGLQEMPLVDQDSTSTSLRPAQFTAVVAQLGQRRVPALFSEPGEIGRSLQRISELSGVPIAPTPLVVDGLARAADGSQRSLMATLVANTCALSQGLKGQCDSDAGARLQQQWEAIAATNAAQGP